MLDNKPRADILKLLFEFSLSKDDNVIIDRLKKMNSEDLTTVILLLRQTSESSERYSEINDFISDEQDHEIKKSLFLEHISRVSDSELREIIIDFLRDAKYFPPIKGKQKKKLPPVTDQELLAAIDKVNQEIKQKHEREQKLKQKRQDKPKNEDDESDSD